METEEIYSVDVDMLLLAAELAAGRLPRLLPGRPAPPRHRARHAPGRCSASRAAAKLRVRVVVTT